MITTNEAQKNWTEIKSRVKSKWSKFNDLELEALKSNLDKLAEQIQKSYGITKQQAETECSDFKKSIETLTAAPPASVTVAEVGPAPKSQAV